jgi:hypothetical protein
VITRVELVLLGNEPNMLPLHHITENNLC